ncbi:MAG: sulfotransferase family 2 domain-containing protein [Magnetococcales bacterium]|nr:sulfotransferase family 2 domain-containing protein [Magnetococcales bacterium]
MLCHDHRVIFVHVPKVAGQSVEQVFLKRLGLSWAPEERKKLLLCANDDPKRGPPRLAHLTAQEYIDLGYVDQQQFSDYFKFGFVRNPWARLVSEYRFRKHPYFRDFKRFVFNHFPTPGWDDRYRHIMPQSDYLYDDQGQCLVDFIGRFENLQADFEEVCRRLNWQPQKLPHANKSSTGKVADRKTPRQWVTTMGKYLLRHRVERHTYPHYSAYYDDETLEYVNRYYAKDIARFSYRFGE